MWCSCDVLMCANPLLLMDPAISRSRKELHHVTIKTHQSTNTARTIRQNRLLITDDAKAKHWQSISPSRVEPPGQNKFSHCRCSAHTEAIKDILCLCTQNQESIVHQCSTTSFCCIHIIKENRRSGYHSTQVTPSICNFTKRIPKGHPLLFMEC